MLRSYHLTHLTDTGKAEKILREMDGLEGVRSVSISEDLKELDVEAEENSFSLIMDRTVNTVSYTHLGFNSPGFAGEQT